MPLQSSQVAGCLQEAEATLLLVLIFWISDPFLGHRACHAEQSAGQAKHATGHSIPVRLLLETSRVVRAERFAQLAGNVPA